MGSTSMATAHANRGFPAPPVGTLQIGSSEWKRNVRLKLDALEVPGTILEFTPEEAEYAGLMEEPAFEGCDLTSEVQDAARELVASYLTAEEQQAEIQMELSAGTLLEELTDADGSAGVQEEDDWFI